MNKRCLCLVGLVTLFPVPVLAQITPDGTVGSTVTPNELINGILSDRINAGSIKGNNLFHSFSEFNINAGRGVYFTNPDGITNIFTRVTGTNPSNIHGTLGVLGNANLFLMNPNGIVFGGGASLDLKGSFLGTTARSINFADGTQFTTANSPLTTPLLSVSVPVGLGFGSNPGAIAVQGTGHHLTATHPIVSPYFTTSPATGLQVQPGKTLALVGGNINLQGGVLQAAQGRVELGSVAETGSVHLQPTASGFALNYTDVPTFGEMNLSGQSLVDTSGFGAGAIAIQAGTLTLSDGSVLWVQNRGIQTAGDISIRADKLELTGTTPDGKVRSSLASETIGLGNNGNINITTQRLLLQQGAGIGNRTFTSAAGGNIQIAAAESVEVNGLSRFDAAGVTSGIVAFTFSTGKAGNLSIKTPHLSVLAGGAVSNATFGSGAGGELRVDAQTVDVIGTTPSFAFSQMSSSTVNSGNAGSFTLNTRTLNLRSGGVVSTTSLGIGNAGSLTVNATESIEVNGNILEDVAFSNISSDVSLPSLLTPEQRAFLSAAKSSSTNSSSGDVTINTPRLKIVNGARVSVQNSGLGEAGTLRVNAGTVLLDNQGRLSATAKFGEGGNISLTANTLQLRHNSAITATAGGTGNGGNLTINARAVAQLENSDITANAVQGTGGNIQITTQGLFSSIDSNITASSQLGISGVVNISTPGINQDNALQEQPTNFVSAEQVVASSCLASRNTQNGKFVITGNGGLPETPDTALIIPYELTQVQSVAINQARVEKEKVKFATPTWKLGDPIVEAKQLVLTSNGRMVLTDTATHQAIPDPQALNCE